MRTPGSRLAIRLTCHCFSRAYKGDISPRTGLGSAPFAGSNRASYQCKSCRNIFRMKKKSSSLHSASRTSGWHLNTWYSQVEPHRIEPIPIKVGKWPRSKASLSGKLSCDNCFTCYLYWREGKDSNLRCDLSHSIPYGMLP